MPEFSLMSSKFLLFAAVAVIALTTLEGLPRKLAFLLLNLVFCISLLLGPVGAAGAVGFCLLGYGLVKLTAAFPARGFQIGVVLYIALFVYMRDYEFLHWFIPEGWLTQTLAVAGLSFLLFKILHVAIEVRSGTLGRLEFLTFTNYCLNFTTFAMGPIQRYQDFYAQWYGEKEAIPRTFEAHLDAVLRILLGLVKVYVLADMFTSHVLPPGSGLIGLSAWDIMSAGYAFYFYLYFNFSGYCDVVIGIGSLMGVRPPENFNRPFIARNVSDFWLRMHRSLTLWLTDYVFSPFLKSTLQGRLGAYPLLATCLALMVTMLVSGLWHGATLSFLLFGLLHGFYLVIYRVWDTSMTRWLGRRRFSQIRNHWLARSVAVVITFNAVSLAYIFFTLDASKAIAEIFGAGAP